MSGTVTFWAWDQPVKPATAKYVLMCLANCHNDKTGRCDPSVAYIAHKTGLNRKTIPIAIARLRKLGLVSIQKRGKHSPLYSFPIARNRAIESAETALTQKRAIECPENGSADTPKSGNETKRESKKNLKGYRTLRLEDVPEGWLASVKEFIDHRVNVKKPLTQAALKRFVKTVERTAQELGMTPMDVITETIDAGWQSVKTEWLRNRLGDAHVQNRSGQDSQGNGAVRLTPSQRTAARREKIRRRELAKQSPNVGVVAEDGGDVRK